MVDEKEKVGQVGQRLSYDGYYGTIKFVGEIEAGKGVWYGVEWDLAERGKHSGNHKGVQYFVCSVESSGSFVKPKRAQLGVSFMEALRERYETNEENDDEHLYVTGANNQLTKVEIIGADKVAELQSQLDKLDTIGLHENQINSAGDNGEIKGASLNVKSLDISMNLLRDWNTIADIVCQLCHLRTLNVSSNRLSLPNDPASLSHAFQNLTQLFINDLNISWEYVDAASVMWPNLKQLHVCQNNISDISFVTRDNFCQLELLNLEKNKIQNWNAVLQFSNLPRLKSLILNENRIQKIDMGTIDNGDEDLPFSALTALSISRNLLDNWTSINELNLLPSLRGLRLKFNPLVEDLGYSYDARHNMISRLGNIKTINGSDVTNNERTDSELGYLKEFAADYYKAGGTQAEGEVTCSAEFMKSHPRYLTLVKEYGPPAHPDSIIVNRALKDRLISINIACPGHSEFKPIVRKLPGTITVLKLKCLLRRLFKVDVEKIKLTYRDRPDYPEIRMADDMRELSYYSLENGNTIYVRWK